MLIAADTRKRELASSAISILDDLEPKIRASKAQQKVMLLDACFIGQGRGEGDPGRDPGEFLRKVSEIASGFEIISASTENQEALEVSGLKHSIFCHFVLKGLSGEAALQDAVMLSSLKSYLLSEIKEYTVRLGLDQMPQGRSDGNLGDFMLVDYTTTPRPNLDASQASNVIQIEPPSVQGRGQSLATQAIKCLWALDCESQCQTFKTNTARSRRAAAFVVQAKDTRIQHWLVKRLVNQIPNVANAKVFSFVVPTHPMWKNRDFGELWLDLSRKLQCSPNQADAIDALVEIYRTKPIIIAMYGWSGMARSQALQKQVLTDLWQPLVEAVGGLETQPIRSRIILFLAEGYEQTTANALVGSDSVIPIRLDPLTEITPDHIAEWIESDQVFPILSQLMSEEELQTLIQDEILEWGSDPVEAIEQICYTFRLENGIADIEAEWRLAG